MLLPARGGRGPRLEPISTHPRQEVDRRDGEARCVTDDGIDAAARQRAVRSSSTRPRSTDVQPTPIARAWIMPTKNEINAAHEIGHYLVARSRGLFVTRVSTGLALCDAQVKTCVRSIKLDRVPLDVGGEIAVPRVDHVSCSARGQFKPHGCLPSFLPDNSLWACFDHRARILVDAESFTI